VPGARGEMPAAGTGGWNWLGLHRFCDRADWGEAIGAASFTAGNGRSVGRSVGGKDGVPVVVAGADEEVLGGMSTGG
jgi:hypothetical protein